MGRSLPASSDTMARSWPGWVDPALVALLAVLVFLPGVFGTFVNWDDERNFLQNADYRGLGWPQLRWMLTTSHMGPWAPLTWVTLGADYLLWGMNPRGYHVTSLLFHAGGATLFLLVARRLLAAGLGTPPHPALSPTGAEGAAAPSPLREDGGGEGAAIRIGAVGAALLFALHPLRVESVVWITERRDVVSGVFYLLTVLAYLAAVGRRAAGRGLGGFYWTSLGCFVLAVLSKSMVVSLPVVLLILDVYPLGRLGGRAGWTGAAARRVLAEKIPFLLVAAAGAAVAFLALRPWGNLLSLGDFGPAQRAAVSVYGLAFYLWKTLVPIGLSPLYALPRSVDPLALPFVFSGVVVLALSAAAVIMRRRWPWLAAAWSAYVVTALPVLGVFQNGPQIAADRYTYLPVLGWALRPDHPRPLRRPVDGRGGRQALCRCRPVRRRRAADRAGGARREAGPRLAGLGHALAPRGGARSRERPLPRAPGRRAHGSRVARARHPAVRGRAAARPHRPRGAHRPGGDPRGVGTRPGGCGARHGSRAAASGRRRDPVPSG